MAATAVAATAGPGTDESVIHKSVGAHAVSAEVLRLGANSHYEQTG